MEEEMEGVCEMKGEGGMHEGDLDVIQPVCGLKVGEPSLVIHIWVANVLQLAEAERRENGGMWWKKGRGGRGDSGRWERGGGRGDGGRGG